MTIARPLARPIVHVAGGWLARQIAALTAADGTKPAAIADFENWRFAIPKLGPELITDPGFDDPSVWGKGTGWDVSGGVATFTGTANAGISQLATNFTAPLVPGKIYRISLDVTLASGTLYFGLNGTPTQFVNGITTSGTYVGYVTANQTHNTFYVGMGPYISGSIDNASLREVMLGESPDFNSPTLRECTFNDWFAYTSSTPAAETYTDQTGVIRTQTYGRNLVSYSDDLTNAAWTKTQVTATAGAITENSASGVQHFVSQTIVRLPGNLTLSAKIKAGTGARNIALRAAGSSGSAYVVFNPSTGAVVTSGVTGSNWTNVSSVAGVIDADGYYYIQATFTHTDTVGSMFPYIQLVNGTTLTYNGDGASSVLVKNIQFEEGSSATTYKPTTSNGSGVDTPRADYSSGSRRLLLENASTNLLVRSQQLNTSWTKTEATVVEGVEVSPDGTQTACRLIENGTFNPHQISQSFGPATSGVSYTISVYAKYETRRYLMVTFGGGAFGSSQYATFDLQSGTVSGSAVGSPDIQALSNGWYRCIFTATCTSTTTGTAFLALSDVATGRSPNYTGDGASSILIWGAQVETSSFASSYIPTQGSTVTRAINTAEFSPMLEAIMQRSAASVLVRGDLSSNIDLSRIVGNDSGNAILFTTSSGGSVATNNGSTSLAAAVSSLWANSPFGAAVGFNSSGRVVTANGVSPQTDASTIGSRTKVYLARSETISADRVGSGTYKLVAIYPTRLSDASLQALAIA